MRRTTILISAILLALPAVAAADTTVVKDQRGETPQIKRNGRMDIVKATAGHRAEQVEHQVKMRKKVRAEKKAERPLIGINTRGGSKSDPEYLVLGDGVFRVREGKDPRQVADASLKARGRTWIYRFDPADLGLDRYGWVAISTKGKLFDTAPPDRYEPHRV